MGVIESEAGRSSPWVCPRLFEACEARKTGCAAWSKSSSNQGGPCVEEEFSNIAEQIYVKGWGAARSTLSCWTGEDEFGLAPRWTWLKAPRDHSMSSPCWPSWHCPEEADEGMPGWGTIRLNTSATTMVEAIEHIAARSQNLQFSSGVWWFVMTAASTESSLVCDRCRGWNDWTPNNGKIWEPGPMWWWEILVQCCWASFCWS